MASFRVSHASRRSLSFLHKKPFHLPSPAATIPSQSLLDEEKCPRYSPKSWYPAKPGEILAEKYQLMTKIGWGSGSTVWLARDMNRLRWQSEEAVALKIFNARESDSANFELEERIARQNPSHQGYGSVRTCLGHFEFNHGEQKHACQIYQPLRETMDIFTKRFPDCKLPLPIAKAYILLLLLGIDYLHAECRIVHTVQNADLQLSLSDLKLTNILMTFENEKVLPRFMQDYVLNNPMEYKIDPKTNRTIYRSINSLGDLEVDDIANMLPKIADFDAAMLTEPNPDPQDKSQPKAVYTYPIQSDYYRAPEVVCGYGWDTTADIWNFGVLMWNIIEGTELFTQVQDAEHRYDPKSHIAEMVGFLGSPPKPILKRMDALAHASFVDDGPVSVDNGPLYSTPRELYGGPYFDEEGNFLYEDLIPKRKLEDTVPSLKGEEKELFLSFAREMLTWDPSARKTAAELAQHPFLNFGGYVVKDLV
ncbi:unnamed protein product [Penicillium salamii]|uniref:non-specific serine/threonine protein kinase n=1 Tax=Penicillium salamii TaxID=1612424 RepID=A0A9W4J1M0_9EURO|nr:unnamed protein product [Penicillium salamii]CAG7966896.1 unnamed protein product [Penicillium salamii]CAG8003231.1 unnamed protein product [Penicillium salamii]CAG8051964.1 unnamed protein product [Penicillium salamii]CAG8200014.1 unnamed protein product [Penicillium salamii]